MVGLPMMFSMLSSCEHTIYACSNYDVVLHILDSPIG